MALREISIALLGLTLATLGSCDLDHPRFVIGSYPFDSLMHGSEHIASFKKLPTEDKAPRKKPLPPFYSLPEEPKIKEILLKSGAPYCQEITPKESRAGSGVEDKRTSCYRCKDPKNGSSYEHCSYSSQPPSDSLGAGSHPAETSRKAREDSAEKLPEAYRFSEDYFQPEASHELPAEYEKKVDNCERVVKDSMVCMICKEPKTSGKYEQCSYVAQPNEKAYAYSKSSSFGGAKPRDEAREQPEESRKRDKQDSEEEQDEDEHSYRYPSYKDYKPSSYGSYEADEEQAAKPNCETVQKDGQSCTVCANPKTGGKSEQCAYSHEPKDKVYKYSKSKSFGYPESASESSRKAEGAESEEEEEGEPSTLDYIRSESEKISKQVKGQGDCRRVKRDDELCTICKDPKTGGENEQCNYSYEPEDKLFAYSKSKSFGSPGKSSSEDEYAGSSEERPEESFVSPSLVYPTGTSALDYIPKSSRAQISQAEEKRKDKPDRVDNGFYDATLRRAEIEKIVKDIGSEDRSKCKKMYRNGMTCYSCADERGFVNEECAFVNEPDSTVSGSIKRKTRATVDEEEKPKDEKDEEELEEAEPYDYVAETRAVYDKVLGISLPAYMITKSAQEAEFDEYVEKANF